MDLQSAFFCLGFLPQLFRPLQQRLPNFFARNSLVLDLELNCLLKRSHASSFLSCRRLALLAVFVFHGALLRGSFGLLEEDCNWQGRGRRLLAWHCVQRLARRGATVAANTSKTFFSHRAAFSAVTATARLTCWATLVALSVSLSPLCTRCGSFLARYPPSSSIVVHDLHQRVSADREDLGALDSAGVDDDDLAGRGLAKPVARVNEVDNDFNVLGPVSSSLLAATYVLMTNSLSPRTRNSTIRRISCSSWAYSWFNVPWKGAPPATMFGATCSNSFLESGRRPSQSYCLSRKCHNRHCTWRQT